MFCTSGSLAMSTAIIFRIEAKLCTIAMANRVNPTPGSMRHSIPSRTTKLKSKNETPPERTIIGEFLKEIALPFAAPRSFGASRLFYSRHLLSGTSALPPVSFITLYRDGHHWMRTQSSGIARNEGLEIGTNFKEQVRGGSISVQNEMPPPISIVINRLVLNADQNAIP